MLLPCTKYPPRTLETFDVDVEKLTNTTVAVSFLNGGDSHHSYPVTDLTSS